jgi:hypothetical protein
MRFIGPETEEETEAGYQVKCLACGQEVNGSFSGPLEEVLAKVDTKFKAP